MFPSRNLPRTAWVLVTLAAANLVAIPRTVGDDQQPRQPDGQSELQQRGTRATRNAKSQQQAAPKQRYNVSFVDMLDTNVFDLLPEALVGVTPIAVRLDSRTTASSSPLARVYSNTTIADRFVRIDGAAGSFVADNLPLANGFLAGDSLVGFDVQVLTRDVGDQQVDIHFELWDGDPLDVLDTNNSEFSHHVIAGSQVDFLDLDASLLTLEARFDDVVLPHNDVWLLMTSSGCRVGWTFSGEAPLIGRKLRRRDVIEVARDSTGVGTCCDTGRACDLFDRSRLNDCKHFSLCGDQIAESGIVIRRRPEEDVTMWVTAYAPAQGVFSLTPVRASGSHTIQGNEIVMPSGGQRVFLEIGLANWSPKIGEGSILCTHDAQCVPLFGRGSICFGGWCDGRLRTFQYTIDASSYTSGSSGKIGPASSETCEDTETCVKLFGPGAACEQDKCEALLHDISRPDWIHAGVNSFPLVDVNSPNIRAGATMFDVETELGPFPDGTTKYGGTFVIDVDPSAKGTFTIRFQDFIDGFTNGFASFMFDQAAPAFPRVGFVPAKITIPVGQCCVGASAETAECLPNFTQGECDARSDKIEFKPD